MNKEELISRLTVGDDGKILIFPSDFIGKMVFLTKELKIKFTTAIVPHNHEK